MVSKKTISLFLVVFLFACKGKTDDQFAVPQSINYINVKQIEKHIRVLSSKEYAGREAGTEGGRKAAEYIARQFKEIGLLPGGEVGSYFQTFHIFDESSLSGKMKVINKEKKIIKFECGVDYTPLSIQDNSFSTSFTLVGYGISSSILQFDEYENVDVEDKIVIIFSGVPWHYASNHWFSRISAAKEFGTLEYKVKNAEKHGASAVFIVENPAGWRRDLETEEILKAPENKFLIKAEIPVLQITRKALQKITAISLDNLHLLAKKIDKECLPQSIDFTEQTISATSTIIPTGRWIGRNVIGVIPGGGQELKKEAIVIGAHYDHLGQLGNEIYYGANDNASGVSALLSIAQSFSKTTLVSKRTIIFIAFDAEEMGKVGSFSYIDKPLISLKDTVLMINFDMIGRNDPNHVFAVASESSRMLHYIHQQQNKHVGLKLGHPVNFRLGKSDHTGFYRARIPVIYFFGGKHKGYHRPSDTWDLLSLSKIVKIAKLAFLTAHAVANKSQKLIFQRQKSSE
ncbi:M28 family peptidase [Candidatus Uabimicrobium sp. HlEnr_7]|uniref:M28 family peptidase n=1 Tax=Candidatus Uabimicrobium helgolandensis TaxID=3095367 RepID=UPI003556160B